MMVQILGQRTSKDSNVKHVQVKYNYVRDLVDNNHVAVIYTLSAENLANPFTKALIGTTFERLGTEINVISTNNAHQFSRGCVGNNDSFHTKMDYDLKKTVTSYIYRSHSYTQMSKIRYVIQCGEHNKFFTESRIDDSRCFLLTSRTIAGLILKRIASLINCMLWCEIFSQSDNQRVIQKLVFLQQQNSEMVSTDNDGTINSNWRMCTTSSR